MRTNDSLTAERPPLICALIPLQFVFLASIIPSLPGHPYDSYCWRTWTKHILDNGLLNAYGSGTDYPPVMQYVLWIFGKVAGTAESIDAHYGYLRLLTYGVDLLGLYMVWRWTGKRFAFPLIAIFSLLNIGASYNTVLWGQVDGILAALVFGAMYLTWKDRFIAGGVILTVAVLFKMQAIVFIPVWGLLALAGVARTRRWRAIPLTLLAMAVTAALLFLPFILTPSSRALVTEAMFGSVGRYPKISMNAHNWWQVMAWRSTGADDSQPWLAGYSYKTWGLAAFFAASALALLPMMQYAVKQFGRTSSHNAFPREKLWLTASLISLNFFFWPTQIHERYSHPALIFLLALALGTRDWVPYVLFSMAYFLNMEAVLRALKFNNYDTAFFDPRLDAVLFGVLLLYLFLRLFGWRGFARKPAETVEATFTS